MEIPTLPALKAIKNDVIGNPTAKAAVARGGVLPSLFLLLDPPQPSSSEADVPLRTEATHIISSIAYGATDTLDSLLQLDATRHLLSAISRFRQEDSPSFKSSLVRALGNLATSCADIVGPPLWGITREFPDIAGAARHSLDEIFKADSLDVLLPLAQDPSDQVVLSTITFLSSCLRIQEHRNAVSQWLPLAERRALSSRRGWEQQPRTVPRLGWTAHRLIQILSSSQNAKPQEAALWTLAALTKDNSLVAQALIKDGLFKEIVAFTSSRSTGCQLAACLCIVNVLRIQNPPTQPRSNIALHNTMRTVATNTIRILLRVIENTRESYVLRNKACFILSTLVADDPELELTACSAGVLKVLIDLLQKVHDDKLPQWLDVEFEHVSQFREAGLLAVASLAMHQDDVRRDAISLSVIPILQGSLAHPHFGVRHAACQCARALTRSVQVLRTSVVDSGISSVIFDLVKDPAEDRRVRTAALAALCNLLNSFSPFRETIISQGGARYLAGLLGTSEYPWKLNSLWAIKNALNSCKLSEKVAIMEQLGWERLRSLAITSDEGLQEQAYAILRNLAFPSSEVGFLLSGLGQETIIEVTEIGMASSAGEILTQSIGLFTNLIGGSNEIRYALLARPSVMLALKEALQHVVLEVRRVAAQCVLQLVKTAPRRHGELREYGFDVMMRHMVRPQGVAGTSQYAQGPLGFEKDHQVERDLRDALKGLDFVRE